MTSCIDPSARIVTNSLKVGPLLIFSISLHLPEPLGGTYLEDKGLNELGLEDVAKRDPVEKLEERV